MEAEPANAGLPQSPSRHREFITCRDHPYPKFAASNCEVNRVSRKLFHLYINRRIHQKKILSTAYEVENSLISQFLKHSAQGLLRSEPSCARFRYNAIKFFLQESLTSDRFCIVAIREAVQSVKNCIPPMCILISSRHWRTPSSLPTYTRARPRHASTGKRRSFCSNLFNTTVLTSTPNTFARLSP